MAARLELGERGGAGRGRRLQGGRLQCCPPTHPPTRGGRQPAAREHHYLLGRGRHLQQALQVGLAALAAGGQGWGREGVGALAGAASAGAGRWLGRCSPNGGGRAGCSRHRAPQLTQRGRLERQRNPQRGPPKNLQCAPGLLHLPALAQPIPSRSSLRFHPHEPSPSWQSHETLFCTLGCSGTDMDASRMSSNSWGRPAGAHRSGH